MSRSAATRYQYQRPIDVIFSAPSENLLAHVQNWLFALSTYVSLETVKIVNALPQLLADAATEATHA